MPVEAHVSVEVLTVQTAETIPVEEEWATPATQRDTTQQQPDPPIDPRLGDAEGDLSSIQVQVDGPSDMYTYPLDGLEGAATARDADMAGQHVRRRRWRLATRGDNRYTIPSYLGGNRTRHNPGESLQRMQMP